MNIVWFAEVIPEEAVGEKSTVNAIDLNSNISLPLPTIHEDDKSLPEYQTSVPITGHRDFRRRSHIIAPADVHANNLDTDNGVADTVLNGKEANLKKHGDTTDASFNKGRNHDDNFLTVPGGVARDQDKDNDTSMIFCGLEKGDVQENNDNVVSKGFDEDFVTMKELSTVLAGVENDEVTDGEMCTVSTNDERTICSSENVNATVADAKTMVVKDENDNELKTGNQVRQTAQPDYFPDPPQEFWVRSIYLMLLAASLSIIERMVLVQVLSPGPSVSLSVSLSVTLSVCLFVCLSVALSVALSGALWKNG